MKNWLWLMVAIVILIFASGCSKKPKLGELSITADDEKILDEAAKSYELKAKINKVRGKIAKMDELLGEVEFQEKRDEAISTHNSDEASAKSVEAKTATAPVTVSIANLERIRFDNDPVIAAHHQDLTFTSDSFSAKVTQIDFSKGDIVTGTVRITLSGKDDKGNNPTIECLFTYDHKRAIIKYRTSKHDTILAFYGSREHPVIFFPGAEVALPGQFIY